MTDKRAGSPPSRRRCRTSWLGDDLLHTLDNLTLTTSRLGVEISNEPWADELVKIGRASGPALNRDVTTRYADSWDETTTRDCGRRPAEVLIEVWPVPERLLR